MNPDRSARVPREAFVAERSLAVDVGRHRIVVTLTDRGPFAYADRCPHRGAPMLAGGRIVTPLVPGSQRLLPGSPASHVRCPWHKWDYDMETGRCAVDPRMRLRTYPAWIDGDDIVVSIDGRANRSDDE